MTQVVIEKMACYYGPGAKTKHSDKIWGLCKIDNTLVTFWGKRGGRLQFKTRAGAAGREEGYAKWQEKIGGRRDGGDVYTEIKDDFTRKLLCPNFMGDVASNYYSKMSLGQLKKG